MMSMSLKPVTLALSTALLAACSSSNDLVSGGGRIDRGLNPSASLITLNVDGSLPDQDFSENGTKGDFSLISDVNGRITGFAYQYGRKAGTDEFIGVAGIAPLSNPGPLPNAATATYTGDYALTYVDRDEVDTRRGTITLDADFSDGVLEGTAGGLNIDGSITGQIIGGSATYRGIDADLTGLIGSQRAVGAFAGDSNNALLVGGFNADAND